MQLGYLYFKPRSTSCYVIITSSPCHGFHDRNSVTDHIRLTAQLCVVQQQTGSGRKKKGGASTAAPSPSPSPSAARSANRVTHAALQAERAAAAIPASVGTSEGKGGAVSQGPAPATTHAAHAGSSGVGNSRASPAPSPSSLAAASGADKLRRTQQGIKASVTARSDKLAADEAPSTSAAPPDDDTHTASSDRAGDVPGSPAGSSSRAIPVRSNRRPGGAPASSSYRPSQQHRADEDCQHGEELPTSSDDANMLLGHFYLQKCLLEDHEMQRPLVTQEQLYQAASSVVMPSGVQEHIEDMRCI